MEIVELQPGISKKILKAGEGGPLAETGEQITVHYTGKLENGEVFDSSVTRGQPFECQIGVGQVIKGWDVGMMSMAIGEKAELTISGEHGYGAQGSPPKIPPNATLIFEVELLKIGDREPVGMTDDELNKAALEKKAEATTFFKQGDMKAAADLWKEGVSLLGKMREPANEHKVLMVQMSQNVAIASNKSGNHAEAVLACTNALKIDEKADKALMQRSIAHMKRQDWEKAQADCK